MALLQISEPGASPDPHQQRRAVGIDLGTTHSLVATVRSGVAGVIADEQGRALLPSIMRYFPDGRVASGYEARATQSDDPANTIVSVKRFMGRGVADVAKYGALPYRFVDAPGMVAIETARGAPLAGAGLRRDPQGPARAGRERARRRALRRRGDGAGLLRRFAAPGHQGRRPARGAQRAAPVERAHRGGDRLRPRPRFRGHVRDLRSRRRHLRHLHPQAHARRLRGAVHQRRFGARGRRFRPGDRDPLARGPAHRRCRRRRHAPAARGRARGEGATVHADGSLRAA